MKKKINNILTIFISLIWFINGLFCKILNFVPRHEQIVAGILGSKYSKELTIIIGVLEIGMAIWILIKFKSKFNAITQIIIIATMNIIEFFYVPELLLWGKYNSLFALILIFVIYYNEFILKRKLNQVVTK